MTMEVKIKKGDEFIEATIEMVDGVMVVSPKAEKFEPKDGDVVSTQSGTHIFICKKYIGGIVVDVYFGWDFEENVFFNSDKWVASRFATEEEKKKLFDKLSEEGYEWKAATKELVKLKWKPKYKETYFAPFFSNVDFLFSTCSHIYTEHFTDEITIEKMGAFKTEDECQSFCDKLNKAINQVKP